MYWYLFLFLSVSSVYAETKDLSNMSLQELMTVEVPTVVGASKYKQKITDAPSDVSIMTADDIRKFGYRTLADILNGVRDFYTTFDGAYNFLGVRGVNRPGDYGGRFLLNINGHRMNEPIYDSLLINYEFPLDVDLIERVEIIRGPGSVLYGNNAFFGIINVVTRETDRFPEHGGEIAGSYASEDFKQGRITQTLNFESGPNILLSGSYYDSRGALEINYPNYPGVPPGKNSVFDHDHMNALNVFGKASYKDFTLEALYGQRYREFPSAPYRTVLGNPNTNVADARAYTELRYEHDFSRGLHLLARIYGDYYAYDGTQAMPPTAPRVDPIINQDKPRALWWGVENQLSQTFFSKLRLTLGAEFRQDPLRYLSNHNLDPAKTIIDKNFPMFSVGSYLQGEFNILNNLVLNAGLRYDYFSTFGNTLNPRAALIYHPWEPTTFKFLFGQAYRAPNAYEFNYLSTSYKDSLKPETIRSYELVWEQAFEKHYRVNTGLFLNNISGLIAQRTDSNNNTIFVGVDSTRVLGGTVGLETNWGKGWRGRINYTYSNAVNADNNQHLSNSPEHMGKLQLVVPLYQEKIFGSIELLAMSDRQTSAGNNRLPGFIVGNLTLFSVNLVKNLEISGSIYNFWNQQRNDPVAPDFVLDSVAQPGLSVRAKLIYRF